MDEYYPNMGHKEYFNYELLKSIITSGKHKTMLFKIHYCHYFNLYLNTSKRITMTRCMNKIFNLL